MRETSFGTHLAAPLIGFLEKKDCHANADNHTV